MSTHIKLKNIGPRVLRIKDAAANTTVIINPSESAHFKSAAAALASGTAYATAYAAGYIASANVTDVSKDHRPAPSWVGFRDVHPWWQAYDTTKSPWAVGWGILSYSPLGVTRDDKSEVATSFTPVGGSGGSVTVTGRNLGDISYALFDTSPSPTRVDIPASAASATSLTLVVPSYSSNGPIDFSLYDAHDNRSPSSLTYYYGAAPTVTTQSASSMATSAAASGFSVSVTGTNFKYGTTDYLYPPTSAQSLFLGPAPV